MKPQTAAIDSRPERIGAPAWDAVPAGPERQLMNDRATAPVGSPESMPKYWIAQHVHVCRTESGVVLLDLRRNRYLGVADHQLRSLSAAVSGWPLALSSIGSATASPPPGTAAFAESLVRDGLLTTEEANGKEPRIVLDDRGSMMQAVGFEIDGSASIRVVDVVNFLAACASTACALRWKSLEATVEHVRARKERASRDASPADRDLAELVRVFRRLRTYVFTARGRCLFHSLALIEFLARYGLFPTWVIGVRTGPFSAHSWVQEGMAVLDQTPEQIGFFTPILAV